MFTLIYTETSVIDQFIRYKSRKSTIIFDFQLDW